MPVVLNGPRHGHRRPAKLAQDVGRLAESIAGLRIYGVSRHVAPRQPPLTQQVRRHDAENAEHQSDQKPAIETCHSFSTSPVLTIEYGFVSLPALLPTLEGRTCGALVGRNRRSIDLFSRRPSASSPPTKTKKPESIACIIYCMADRRRRRKSTSAAIFSNARMVAGRRGRSMPRSYCVPMSFCMWIDSYTNTGSQVCDESISPRRIR